MRNRMLLVLGCLGISLLVACMLIISGWFVNQGMSGEGPLAMLATATKTPRPTRTPEPTYTLTSTPTTTNTSTPTHTHSNPNIYSHPDSYKHINRNLHTRRTDRTRQPGSDPDLCAQRPWY